MTEKKQFQQLELLELFYDRPSAIYFHADFDGICSAALLLRRFGLDITVRPVTYALKKKWLAMNLRGVAVVDFLFHPQASWWYDHHATSFVSDHIRTLYRADARHRWDSEYKSCPTLILSVLAETEDVSVLRRAFEYWRKWSDIIDSAAYESPRQAVFGTEPAILINQALSQTPSLKLREYLVRKIAEGVMPADLCSDDQVKPLWQDYRCDLEKAVEAIRKSISVEGRVGVCDVSDKRLPFVRYGTYLVNQSIEFSVMVFRSFFNDSQPYKIMLSRNPWRTAVPSRVNLGEIAGRYGGGGRTSVGSVNCSTKTDCRNKVHEIIRTIQEAEDGEGKEQGGK